MITGLDLAKLQSGRFSSPCGKSYKPCLTSQKLWRNSQKVTRTDLPTSLHGSPSHFGHSTSATRPPATSAFRSCKRQTRKGDQNQPCPKRNEEKAHAKLPGPLLNHEYLANMTTGIERRQGTQEDITMENERQRNKMEPTNPNANTFEKLHMSK